MTEKITRQMVLDAAKISQEIIDKGLSGEYAHGPKNEEYKRLKQIKEYKDTYNKMSPNVMMKRILKTYQTSHGILDNYEVTGHPYRGNVINSYEWACITPETSGPKPRHLVLPQLYILINSKGIRFGSVYGENVEPSSPFVYAVSKNPTLQKKIYDVLKTKNNNICLWDGGEMSGEDLPTDETKKQIKEWSDVGRVWRKTIRLIGYFYKKDVPNDIHDRIISTLDFLLPIYKSISTA